MQKGVVKRRRQLGLVGGGGKNDFWVDAGGWRHPKASCDTIITGGNVGIDFANRTHALAGAPRILFSGHSLSEAYKFLLIRSNFIKELAPGATNGSCGGRSTQSLRSGSF